MFVRCVEDMRSGFFFVCLFFTPVRFQFVCLRCIREIPGEHFMTRTN